MEIPLGNAAPWDVSRARWFKLAGQYLERGRELAQWVHEQPHDELHRIFLIVLKHDGVAPCRRPTPPYLGRWQAGTSMRIQEVPAQG